MALSEVYPQTYPEEALISQEALNIANKTRSNPLPWKGQFSPQLAQALLAHYAVPGAFVYDPFLGSGTLLLEAGRAGLPAAGAEINPAAIALSRIYRLINAPHSQRKALLGEMSQLLRSAFPAALPLFHRQEYAAPAAPEDLKTRLVALRQTARAPELLWLMDGLITLLDFYKPDLSTDKIHKVWRGLERTVLGLPFSRKNIAVFHADARLAPLPDLSVDLVITSPPYINVFNYHQQYRASMEALNWNLLQTAKSEFGANRKHRGNRFLTVIQYCLDIGQTFAELNRICRPGARLIFVAGRESTVRGVKFRNGEIVTAVASTALGFQLRLRQERVFRNRFGRRIYEDILHFSPPGSVVTGDFLPAARRIATDILAGVLENAPESVQADIHAALSAAGCVQPSPLFEPNKAVKRHA